MKPRTPEDEIRGIARQMARGRYWQDANLWAELDLKLGRSLSSYAGLHSELTFTPSGVPATDLMVACLLSDVTSIHIRGGVQVGFDVAPIESAQWAFPELHQALHDRYSRIDYGCYLPLGADEVCSAIEPLTAAGRLLVRPDPALFLYTHEGDRFDVRVDRNLPCHLPLAKKIRSAQEAIPMQRTLRFAADQQQLVCLALPLLSNVSFKTYARILDDEDDVIASLRAEIKQLVTAARQQDAALEERYADVVKPAIDRVARRFRTIQKMHSLRATGAVVTTTAISLTALTGTGVAASIAAFLGPAGLGLVAKEVADFLKAHTELREMPFYLLWRLQKAH